MEPDILFVDDDPNILSAFKRQFHGKLNVTAAESGEKALHLIEEFGPFQVIVSDYKMPGMNGAEFLEKASAAAPASVKILLSGQADMEGLADIINRGNLFRYLSKPCPPDLLFKNIMDGVEQFRLARAEKELLEKTLSSSIKVLIDILSIIRPVAFGRALRIRSYMKKYAEAAETESSWQLEISALLSQIGCAAIAESVLHAAYTGAAMTPDEFHIFQKHPQTGFDMISNIPRLETVAQIILYQNKNFNGTGFPEDGISGGDIPFGARLLRIAGDYDVLLQSGRDHFMAANALLSRMHSGWYDPEIAEKFCKIISGSRKYKKLEVAVEKLDETMILAEDIRSAKSGDLVGRKGQIVTKAFRLTMINLKRTGNIDDTLHVVIPAEE